MDPTVHIRYAFNVAFALCICPFRIKVNKPDSVQFSEGIYYSKQSWLLQKIICVCQTLLASLWLIQELIMSVPDDKRNPSRLFRFIANVSDTILKIFTMKMFWINSENFLRLLGYLVDETNHVPRGKTKLSSRLVAGTIVCLYTSMAIFNWISGSGRLALTSGDARLSNWTLSWWWNRNVISGYHILFLKHRRNASPEEVYSSLDIFLGILGAAGNLQRRLWGVYTDLIIFVTVLTFNSCARLFAKNVRFFNEQVPSIENFWKPKKIQSPRISHVVIQVQSETNWKIIYKQYNAMKVFAILVNRTVGINLGYFLVVICLYFANNLDEIFLGSGREDYGKIVRSIFYYFNYISILLISADTCHKMNTLREWFSVEGNRMLVPFYDLCVITNELDNKIAVRGGNIYPISYSLVAHLIGVTLTYFIVCLQFQSGK